MTIHRFWCKGCGARLEPSAGGYCRLEECQSLKTIARGEENVFAIERTLKGGVLREQLLRDIAAEPISQDYLSLTVQLREQPYDVVNGAFRAKFEALKAGRPFKMPALPKLDFKLKIPGLSLGTMLDAPDVPGSRSRFMQTFAELGQYMGRSQSGRSTIGYGNYLRSEWFGFDVDWQREAIKRSGGELLRWIGRDVYVFKLACHDDDAAYRGAVLASFDKVIQDSHERATQFDHVSAFDRVLRKKATTAELSFVGEWVEQMKLIRAKGEMTHKLLMGVSDVYLSAIGFTFNHMRDGQTDEAYRKRLALIPELSVPVRNRNPHGTGHNAFVMGSEVAVKAPFSDAHGRHLDDVAKANGVMRKPGEDDLLLRSRLQTYFAQR